MPTEAKPKMTLGQKMIAIMDEMQAVKKEGFNVNQKYPFVQEADVVNAVRPLLIKYGVLIHQTVFVGPDGIPWVQKGGPDGKITTIVYEMQLMDAETGEVWPKSLIAQDGWDQGDKGPNKTLTGANKWFHMRTWQIGAGTKEESEADEKVDKAAAAAGATKGPVVVGKSSVAGAGRGGKSAHATAAQVTEIARLAGKLELDADSIVPVIKKVIGTEPAEGQNLRDWLGALTSEQAAGIIAAMVAMDEFDAEIGEVVGDDADDHVPDDDTGPVPVV